MSSDGARPERGIPGEMLARIRRIEIRARRLVANVFVGQYHSIFKGRGIEFAEVRPYEPGDDVRAIDWNVTARMGTPYVKQYIEERQLTVLLAVDISASSAIASAGVSKRELAAEVAATLAFSALANGDQVGLVAFAGGVERFVAPAKGRQHVLRLIRDLLYLEPTRPGTDIGGALAFLARVARRRAIVFLLSDFYDEGYERQLRAAALRHEIIPVSLNDPRDATVPDAGLVTVRDPESGASVVLDSSSRRVREAYARRAAELRARRRRIFAAAGLDEVELHTDRPFVPALLRAFRQRERAGRRPVPGSVKAVEARRTAV